MTGILAAPILMTGGAPVSLSQTDSGHDTTISGTATFSAMDIGAAQGDRWIYVAATAEANLNMSSSTIGGGSAEIVAGPGRNTGPTPDTGSAIWRALVPSGTDVTVTVTFSGGGTGTHVSITVYRAVGGEGDFEQAANSNDAGGISLSPPAGSATIAVAAQNGVSSVTWSDITEVTQFANGSDGHTAAARVDATAPGAITVATSVSANRNMSAVVIT